ncbi:PREDICTED: cytochrome c oxidase subunit 6b-1-like isoform X2 [Lupinus angustifolius]|uniref:cytochrome c oxidase subunit 6b-1-like isoform X2 n=1 Tax=Lupinus angustifolius TaxID=3871 RepID=UPI00092FC339|nr:PREDICTED: cytochrome c oxidase subunit 6b-1-like isoform X2 [Lupinus angustifolius]
MAQPASDNSPTLAEQYFVNETQEKTDIAAKHAEVKEVENPNEAASEEAPVEETVDAPVKEQETVEVPVVETVEAPVAETVEAPVSETIEAPVSETVEAPVAETVEAPVAETVEAPVVETVEAAVEKTVEATPTVVEESSEATLPAEQSTDPTSNTPEVINEATIEQSSGNTAEETPGIKIETAPADFRFPTTNQTRHCFTRYVEFHRCVAAKGEDAPECDKFAKYYRSLCPGEWVDRWNEQRENGTFPGPL